MFEQQLKNKLSLLQKQHLYRDPVTITERRGRYITIDGRKVLNFASNDYLGLSQSQLLCKKCEKHISRYGLSSSSSRLVTGNYAVIQKAETAYADYFGYESALFFPSGFQANLALLSCLFDPDHILLFDKHIHASAVKGIELSKAEFSGYKHNSMRHLEKKLNKHAGKQHIVVTESLFSMDGDLLPVNSLFELKDTHSFYCIVDEAHSFGVLGSSGKGISRSCADIAVGTLGKAFGFHGAFLLLPQVVKDYLFNYASPLIYSTTLPPYHAVCALDILETVARAEKERAHLRQLCEYTQSKLREHSFQFSGDAHIIAITLGQEEKAVSVAKRLLEKNIFVLPARYPTVPLHQAIIRISVTAEHTEEDIDLLLKELVHAAHS